MSWRRYCNKGLHSSCDVTNPSETQEFLYGHRTAGIHGAARLLHGSCSHVFSPPLTSACTMLCPDVCPQRAVRWFSARDS